MLDIEGDSNFKMKRSINDLSNVLQDKYLTGSKGATALIDGDWASSVTPKASRFNYEIDVNRSKSLQKTGPQAYDLKHIVINWAFEVDLSYTKIKFSKAISKTIVSNIKHVMVNGSNFIPLKVNQKMKVKRYKSSLKNN